MENYATQKPLIPRQNNQITAYVKESQIGRPFCGCATKVKFTYWVG